MNFARLFRCSNEKGYFTVAEKCEANLIDLCKMNRNLILRNL